jgi:hypothetical protein
LVLGLSPPGRGWRPNRCGFRSRSQSNECVRSKYSSKISYGWRLRVRHRVWTHDDTMPSVTRPCRNALRFSSVLEQEQQGSLVASALIGNNPRHHRLIVYPELPPVNASLSKEIAEHLFATLTEVDAHEIERLHRSITRLPPGHSAGALTRESGNRTHRRPVPARPAHRPVPSSPPAVSSTRDERRNGTRCDQWWSRPLGLVGRRAGIGDSSWGRTGVSRPW